MTSGSGRSARAHERQEALLEVAAGERRRAALGRDQSPQAFASCGHGRARSRPRARRGQQPEDVACSSARSTQAIGNDGTEVDQGPRRRRDRNPIELGDVPRVEATDTAKVDSLAPRPSPAGGDRDVDPLAREWPACPTAQRPTGGSGPRPRPAREDGREETALGPELLVAERVHAPPEALEPPGGEPVLDAIRGQARTPEPALAVTTPNCRAAIAASARHPAALPQVLLDCRAVSCGTRRAWPHRAHAGARLCDGACDAASRPRCPGRPGAPGGVPRRPACGRSARPRAPRARSGGSRGR